MRFVRRDLRDDLFFNKKQLKSFNAGKKIKTSITEHLTPYNLELLNKAKASFGRNNAWSSKCLIFALVNGSKVNIRNEADLSYYYYNNNNAFRTPDNHPAAGSTPNSDPKQHESLSDTSDVPPPKGKIPVSTVTGSTLNANIDSQQFPSILEAVSMTNPTNKRYQRNGGT